MAWMQYEIIIHEPAMADLEDLRAFEQRALADAIEQHLSHQPTRPTRRRKCLPTLTPCFEYVAPLWQLRVGDFRIFYDVETVEQRVHIRAVRRKGPEQRTEDIT
jgi:mRNA-degrading endonuclease RelE of RelBE toxin-antitoxin system